MAEKVIGGVPRWRGIAGYSLTGLFALYYAIYQTDLFSRVGSISGTLWFPGMKEYIFSMSQSAGRNGPAFLWKTRRSRYEILFY